MLKLSSDLGYATCVMQLRPFPRLQCSMHTFHRVERRKVHKLAFDCHGNHGQTQGEPIVILHGLFGSKKNNGSISRALRRELGRPVYSVDLRNHGESPHNQNHTYTALAEDTEAFIQEHGLMNPTLIGHSMGAKTVMTMALRYPNRYKNIIAVDNAPVHEPLTNDFHMYVEGMRRIKKGKVLSLREAEAIMMPYAEESSVCQFLLRNLTRSSPNGPLHFRIPVSILADALGEMGDFPFKGHDEGLQFTKPTLVIRGTRSHYVPNKAIPMIGRFFPDFELVDIDAGHWVITDNFGHFRQVVVEFLQRNQ